MCSHILSLINIVFHLFLLILPLCWPQVLLRGLPQPANCPKARATVTISTGFELWCRRCDESDVKTQLYWWEYRLIIWKKVIFEPDLILMWGWEHVLTDWQVLTQHRSAFQHVSWKTVAEQGNRVGHSHTPVQMQTNTPQMFIFLSHEHYFFFY